MGFVKLSQFVLRLKRAALPVMGAVLFSASFLCGQQISGTITGAVKDSQQAAVPNAKITLNNAERGTMREGATAPDGSFVFAQVQPGSYNMTVEATGFSDSARSRMLLAVVRIRSEYFGKTCTKLTASL